MVYAVLYDSIMNAGEVSRDSFQDGDQWLP